MECDFRDTMDRRFGTPTLVKHMLTSTLDASEHLEDFKRYFFHIAFQFVPWWSFRPSSSVSHPAELDV